MSGTGSGTAISQLPPATSVVGGDLIPIVETASIPFITKRATVSQFLQNALPATGGNLTGNLTISPGNLDVVGSVTVEGNSLYLDNSQWIYWKDNVGIYQPIIQVDSSNDTLLRTAGGSLVVQNEGATTTMMSVDGSGNFTFPGVGAVGGNGIEYRYTGNHFGFGWNGFINCYVDGSYIGDIATTSWVNSSVGSAGYATQSWVSSNFLNTGTADGRYLFKGGDTCTGSLGVNGNLSVGGALNVAGAAVLTSCVAGGYGVIYANYSATNAFAFANVGGGYIYGYENGSAVGSLVPPSSASVKEDITPATYDCLSAVSRTPLYSFRYAGSDVMKPVGFIAEHQHEVFPESVLMDGGAPFGIDIMTAVATLYGAMQQLTARLEAMERRG